MSLEYYILFIFLCPFQLKNTVFVERKVKYPNFFTKIYLVIVIIIFRMPKFSHFAKLASDNNVMKIFMVFCYRCKLVMGWTIRLIDFNKELWFILLQTFESWFFFLFILWIESRFFFSVHFEIQIISFLISFIRFELWIRFEYFCDLNHDLEFDSFYN